MLDELEILNAMLAATGASAVSTTASRHPDVHRGLPIIHRWNRTVQVRGHWFNTEWGLKLLPSDKKEFILPQNTLKADTSIKSEPYVRRGRRMYDPKKHTYAIDATEIKLDVVIQLDLADVPYAAADLIKAYAVAEFVNNEDADALGIRTAQQEIGRAQQAFAVERLSQADLTLRDNPAYARIMRGANIHGVRNNPQFIGGY